MDEFVKDLIFPRCLFGRDSKYPGPEGPALVRPGGVIGLMTFTNRVQVLAQPLAAEWVSLIEK